MNISVQLLFTTAAVSAGSVLDSSWYKTKESKLPLKYYTSKITLNKLHILIICVCLVVLHKMNYYNKQN